MNVIMLSGFVSPLPVTHPVTHKWQQGHCHHHPSLFYNPLSKTHYILSTHHHSNLYFSQLTVLQSTMKQHSTQSNGGIDFVPIPRETSQYHILGLGATTVDLIGTVEEYPRANTKIRTTSFEVQSGGNCGNTLTAIRRLGIRTSIISKIGGDNYGLQIKKDLQKEDIGIQWLISKKGIRTNFTYIILDKQKNTRTCIHTPTNENILEHEICLDHYENNHNVGSNTCLVHVDGRHISAAIKLVKWANMKRIPVLLDVEKERPFIRDLIPLADFVVTNSEYPIVFCKNDQINKIANHDDKSRHKLMLKGMTKLLECGRAKFVTSTMGSRGCILLTRSKTYSSSSITNKNNGNTNLLPEIIRGTYYDDETHANYVTLRCASCTPKDIVDTTGAGDAFIGGVAYGIVTKMNYENILQLGSVVACHKIEKVGARSGLPSWMDLVKYGLLDIAPS